MSAKWESVEEHSKMSHSPGLKKRSSLLSTFKDDKIEKYMKQPYKPEYTPKGIGEDFLNAVILRDFYTIKKILSETENRDKILNYQGARNGVETTALQIAAEANDFTMVKFLLENGAQPLDPKKFNSCTQEERVYCFYRALSSPAYLSMLYYKEIKDRQESGDKNTKKPVSKDVLLKACEMSYELHTAAAGMDLKSWKVRQTQQITVPVYRIPYTTSLASDVEAVTDILDNVAPIKQKVVIDKVRAPWYCEELLLLRKQVRRLETKYCSTNLEVDHQIFLAKRREYFRRCDQLKANYHRNRIQEADDKGLFNIIAELSDAKTINSKVLPGQVKPEEIPPQFMNFFNTKVSSLRDGLPSP